MPSFTMPLTPDTPREHDQRRSAGTQCAETLRTENVASSATNAGAVSGIVFHEIRGALFVVRAVAQLLNERQEQLSEYQRSELVEQLDRATRYLDEVTLSMLALTEGDGALEPVLVGRIARSAARRHMERYLGRKVDVDNRACSGLALGNPVWISIVLDNLLQNAEKYGDRFAPIRVLVVEEDTNVVVRVINTGPSILPSDAGRLFEPGYRDASTAGSAHGHGLGLAGCKYLAERMQGTIAAWPRLDGMLFELSIPRCLADADDGRA